MTPHQQMEALANFWLQEGRHCRDEQAQVPALAEWYEGRASVFEECEETLREVLAQMEPDK